MITDSNQACLAKMAGRRIQGSNMRDGVGSSLMLDDPGYLANTFTLPKLKIWVKSALEREKGVLLITRKEAWNGIDERNLNNPKMTPFLFNDLYVANSDNG